MNLELALWIIKHVFSKNYYSFRVITYLYLLLNGKTQITMKTVKINALMDEIFKILTCTLLPK